MPIVVVLPAPGHGHIHLHVKEAHIEHNEGGLFHKMDPQIHLSLGDHHWHTTIAENGGKNPKWHGEYMKCDIPVMPHHLKIRVLNLHGGKQDVVLGHAEVPFKIFHDEGPKDKEVVEFFHEGHKAGHIHFVSEFHSH